MSEISTSPGVINVTITGTGPTGPQGEKGETGDTGPTGANGLDGIAATIAIGTVTTLDPDEDAIVENTGTSSAAVFDFGIPKGEKGDTGETGAQGETGENGAPGQDGRGIVGTTLVDNSLVIEYDDEDTDTVGPVSATPPAPTTTDGTYMLYATISDATPVYSWDVPPNFAVVSGTPTNGQFLVYSSADSAYVPTTVPSANGVSF